MSLNRSALVLPGSAQEFSRLARDYDEAARTRKAETVAALRPAFRAEWEAFRGVVGRAASRGSRNP
jgi:hypothetical protein